MRWTPNKVTALRVLVGFAAVALFGHGTWANLAAVVLTVAAIALDALDGHLARKRRMATPLGAQLDSLGDRMIENMIFTYFAVVRMVSLWLPVLRTRGVFDARAELLGGGGMKFEAEEIKEIKEVKEKGGRGAAFFDIDGTLLAKPSLERRFFAELRWQGKIPAQNSFFWLTEALRLGARDFRAVTHANKAYLRGV